jgi:hypothetical protein
MHSRGLISVMKGEFEGEMSSHFSEQALAEVPPKIVDRRSQEWICAKAAS